MHESVETADNLFDYFHERVDEARHDLDAPLGPDVRLYLAQLLAERARSDREAPDAHTLAELHLAAAQARPGEAARTWRELGDRALYTLGWFREQLARRTVGARYYEDMGTAAYARVDRVMDRWFADAFGPIFRELAAEFRAAVAVLGGVRRLHDDEKDLGVLYERWLATGDAELGRRLRRMGLLVPEPARRG